LLARIISIDEEAYATGLLDEISECCLIHVETL